MTNTYNIYCDESCHLLRDKANRNAMVLGAIVCPFEKKLEIFDRIKEIKQRHNFASKFEVKWNKVSISKVDFYKDLIDYFFDNEDLKFRAIVVDLNTFDNNKGDYDTFYYKMYYYLLRCMVNIKDDNKYNIFLDIKDTRSAYKERKLQECLCSNKYDFKKEFISIQSVKSHHVQLIQLADLLSGAISYKNRSKKENAGKLALIKRIEERANLDLTKTNYSSKLNLFFWEGKK